MKKDNLKNNIDRLAFFPGYLVLFSFILTGIFFQEELGNFLNNALYFMANNLGWYIHLISLGSLITALVFIVVKYGDIRIGGNDAKPDFNMFHWIAMSICGGIGTGLLFWAMGEPIFHFATPPVGEGVEPFTREAGIFAVSQAMWNWSFIQYSMYSICAIGFALAGFNMKKSLSFGPIIEAAFGRKMPKLKSVIHALMIFCLGGAVANSMGVGLMQIGAGIEAVTGIAQSPFIWLILAVGMALIFIISCVSGLGNGLQKLSSFTIYIFMAMLVYVFIFGDTSFMTKIGVESIAEIIDNWGSKSLMLNTMASEDTWSANWIIQYWASFIVYAPIIGMFLSRLAKGRTIRQFIIVNVFVPSIFCWLWIAVFGGMTVSLQFNGVVDVWEAVNTYGMQTTIYQILASLPLGSILTVLFLISVATSFSTLADPMSAAISTMGLKKLEIDDEAPKRLKILIGVTITTISYITVASGGVNAVRGLFTLVGFPITFIMMICVVAAFKLMKRLYTEDNYMLVENADLEKKSA